MYESKKLQQNILAHINKGKSDLKKKREAGFRQQAFELRHI